MASRWLFFVFLWFEPQPSRPGTRWPETQIPHSDRPDQSSETKSILNPFLANFDWKILKKIFSYVFDWQSLVKESIFTCLAYCRVGQVTILPFLKIIHFLVYWMVTLVSWPTRVQLISYCVLIGPFVYKKWRNFRVGKIFTQPIVKLMKVWNRRKHFFLVHSSMWTIHI